MIIKKLEDILQFLNNLKIDDYRLGTENDIKVLRLFLPYTSKVRILKLKEYGFIILQNRIPIGLDGEKYKTLLQIRYYE